MQNNYDKILYLQNYKDGIYTFLENAQSSSGNFIEDADRNNIFITHGQRERLQKEIAFINSRIIDLKMNKVFTNKTVICENI